MERLKRFLERFEKRNIYGLPFPDGTEVRRVESTPILIDFYVPFGTEILAPQDGVVFDVVDDKVMSGPTIDYIQSLNFIVIAHENGEYSRVEHLAKGSAMVNVKDRVRKGEIIAITGRSGQMTEPHLGFSVFKISANGAQREIFPRLEKKIE
jgi:murein DD-endopeptidase MepM/ murein hydrolase activator NlpD